MPQKLPWTLADWSGIWGDSVPPEFRDLLGGLILTDSPPFPLTDGLSAPSSPLVLASSMRHPGTPPPSPTLHSQVGGGRVSGLRQNSSYRAASWLPEPVSLVETQGTRASLLTHHTFSRKVSAVQAASGAQVFSVWPPEMSLQVTQRELHRTVSKAQRVAFRCSCSRWGPGSPLSKPEMVCDEKAWRFGASEYRPL